jgi:hypothetical protein
VASRTRDDRIDFIDVMGITHFYAKDKLTFGATPVKHHAPDMPVADLEQKLPPAKWYGFTGPPF